MPLQNRVNPMGRLFSDPSRAVMLMGNRGRLHNRDMSIRTEWTSEHRWIFCTKDVVFEKRVPMDPTRNSYTELFFLDTPTALAAGHRPCAQCKKEEYRSFKQFWLSAGLSGASTASVEAIDAKLDEERREEPRCWSEKLANLPAGAMVRLSGDEAFYLVADGGRLLRWSFDGYTRGPEMPPDQEVAVVTPPSMVRVLEAGFAAEPHSSARELMAL